jgi:UDP-N-acetylmuramate: L-alanyl-gamma-D-glutamyl-meso-diaminopimelate ligase
MHIHILGIAGTMTSQLAIQLKKQGNFVSGSDQKKIFPPISTLLKKNKIPINKVEINNRIDQIIVGSSYNLFQNTLDEFNQVKKLKIPYISATEYISQNIAKKNSIVIAGSFGKTTITSLTAWILSHTPLNPSYMFGGVPKNKFNSLKMNQSDWSVLEGDESIHGLDKFAKFLYYPVKYLLVTAADWEHKDSYSNQILNFNAFKKLVSNIPSDGFLIINQQNKSAVKLKAYSAAKVITYNSPQSDYFLEKTISRQDYTTLIIHTPTGLIKVNTTLIGQFNFENILSSVCLCDNLGLSHYTISKSIFSYRGIKRRLEFIASIKNILFFEDFAQSETRISATLNSLKKHFPDKHIKVLYQPHASFSKYKSSLCQLKTAFNQTDEIVLTQLKFNPNINKKNRITAKDFRACLDLKLTYLPLKKQILEYYKNSLMPNDILIYMSSGGLEGSRIFKSIINNFKK